jgi:hypothetical protein
MTAALLNDATERAVRQLLGLLLGVRDHRDVGIVTDRRYRHAHAAPGREARAPHRAVDVQLAAAIHAANSVLLEPFRSESAHRWKRRLPASGFGFVDDDPFFRRSASPDATSYIR